MSAMEMMVTTLLKATGLNMEDVKNEFVKRIQQFESNVKLLNETLIDIKKDQAAQCKILSAICDHLNIQEPSADDNEQRRTLLTDTRSGQTNSGAEHAA